MELLHVRVVTSECFVTKMQLSVFHFCEQKKIVNTNTTIAYYL